MLRDIHKPQSDDPEPPDEPDRTYVRSRVDDRSWWVKSAYVLEKYRVLVYLLVSVLLALGYRFQTPAGVVESNRQALQIQIDSLRINQIRQDMKLDQATGERAEIRDETHFIARYICSNISAADRYRLGGTDICAAAAHTTGRQ